MRARARARPRVRFDGSEIYMCRIRRGPRPGPARRPARPRRKTRTPSAARACARKNCQRPLTTRRKKPYERHDLKWRAHRGRHSSCIASTSAEVFLRPVCLPSWRYGVPYACPSTVDGTPAGDWIFARWGRRLPLRGGLPAGCWCWCPRMCLCLCPFVLGARGARKRWSRRGVRAREGKARAVCGVGVLGGGGTGS